MNESDINLSRSCCFSGHRPDKLIMPEYELRALLRREIAAAISDGYTTFISGMARGVDILAAEEVLAAAYLHPEIQLICAYPYSGSTEAFARSWRERARAIACRAALCVDVCPAYSKGCYMRRNDWMVAHSSRLIAVFNGTHGGTRSTVARAIKRGLDIHVILMPGDGDEGNEGNDSFFEKKESKKL